MAERFRHDQSIRDIMAKDLSTDEKSALADISSARQNN